jgi:hypothetical protein
MPRPSKRAATLADKEHDAPAPDPPLVQHAYAIEKLTNALRILAAHKGDARERVAHAYIACAYLTEKDFPEKLRSDWRWIEHEVTKSGPYATPNGKMISAPENTMRKRHRQTAAKIAQRMWDLYRAVSGNTEYE